MADFPFKPIPVGNFCSKCCGNCIEKTGDPLAKCCNSLANNGRECYSPNDCKQCTTISTNPTVNRVLKYCQEDIDQVYMYQQQTSCCLGTCYDNRCYKCNLLDGVLPDYDPKTTICCGGSRRDIRPEVRDSCKRCKSESKTTINSNGNTINYTEETVIENFCEIDNPSKPACCYGQCYDPNDGCSTCDDTQKKLIKKCTGIIAGIADDCCGNECINQLNECKTCQTTTDPNTGQQTQKVIDTPDCGECCQHDDGSSECCRPPLKCCPITKTCYDPKCEECK